MVVQEAAEAYFVQLQGCLLMRDTCEASDYHASWYQGGKEDPSRDR